jgi:Predicted transcriptional regulator
MDIASRIKKVRGKLSQDEFAQRLAIHKNSLGRYERGESTPDMSFADKLCTIFGVSPRWFLLGIGEQLQNPSEVPDIIFPEKPNKKPQEKAYRVYDEAGVEVIEADKIDLILIPLVEATLSAGQGSFEVSDKSERKYSFRRDFLQRKGDYKRMVLMRVGGDSMAPSIENGDVVLLDQSQTSPVPGNIYAVGVEDMVYLKRVDARPGKLVLYSDNKDYAPIEVDTRGDMAGQARIIGRAIWWCREA